MRWLIVRSLETAGWMVFLMNSEPPITYGVVLLWTSAVLGRNLLR